jgi:branched-chain amino acid transport system substrate-binding protein
VANVLRTRTAYGVAAVAVATMVLAGCSSSSKSSAGGNGGSATNDGGSSSSPGTSSGSGLPSTIKLISINDQTGTTSFAGVPAVRGAQIAVDAINSSHFLGSTKISVELKDAASSQQTAASLASQAVASHDYAAILGGILSAEAFTVGPIAQKGKLPVIFTQSGSDGVLVGNYTFRATAPFPGYYDVMGQYLKDKGVKTIALLYDSDVSSYVETAKLIQSWKTKYGISVVASKTVVSTTQDFTAPVSALVSAKPDAVAKFLLGTANATALQQLRQAGFKGPVISTNSDDGGTIKGAGADGSGDAWPTDFSPAQSDATAKKFVSEYEAKFGGSVPSNYSAEGYDAVWWFARAVKAVNGATPTDVQKGLAQIAKTGFTGIEGPLTFVGNDERIASPIVVVWDGSKANVVKP